MTGGSAGRRGLNGRASHPRNPQTKRADSSPLSPSRNSEGQLSVAGRAVHRDVRSLAHAGRARHRVPVALREDDDVAGREADGGAPRGRSPSRCRASSRGRKRDAPRPGTSGRRSIAPAASRRPTNPRHARQKRIAPVRRTARSTSDNASIGNPRRTIDRAKRERSCATIPDSGQSARSAGRLVIRASLWVFDTLAKRAKNRFYRERDHGRQEWNRRGTDGRRVEPGARGNQGAAADPGRRATTGSSARRCKSSASRCAKR